MNYVNRREFVIGILLCVIIAAGLVTAPAAAEESQTASREYKIKAAFVFNFLKAVDWPQEVMADANQPIVIGIVGDNPFADAFNPIKDKTVKDRGIDFIQFAGPSSLTSKQRNDLDNNLSIEGFRSCHLLFICSSERKYQRQILKYVNDHPVITVGESKNFVDDGGIFNFLPQTKKAGFEVNLAAGKRAKITISSKLLRIAKRIKEGQGDDSRGK